VIYQTELVIPPNTPVYAPVEGTLGVTVGVVTRVWVRWRWGAGSLCGVKIFREALQVWPTSLGLWFPSTTHDTTWEENYHVADVPLEFVIRAYNLDDTFSHKVYIAVNVQRPSVNQNVQDFLDFLAHGGTNG